MQHLNVSIYLAFGATVLLAISLIYKATRYSKPFLLGLLAYITLQSVLGIFGFYNASHSSCFTAFQSTEVRHDFNTTSSGGNFTFPLYSVCNSTKWALEGFMEALQYELTPFNIVIKNLAPSAVKSEFTNHSDL
jgi:NAD(P)-dependent dehydrogenase (short-subunit alcohol dehydrogenase family)